MMTMMLALLLAAPPEAPNLYSLELELEDAAAKTRALRSFEGRPLIIGMFYGSCGSVCPRLLQRLSAFDEALPPELRAEQRYLLVSFDPKNDVPDRLEKLMRMHELDPSRWTLARVRPEDVRVLAHALGIKYRESPDGGFDHSTVVTLIGGDGELLTRIEGPGAELAPLAERLRALAKPARP